MTDRKPTPIPPPPKSLGELLHEIARHPEWGESPPDEICSLIIDAIQYAHPAYTSTFLYFLGTPHRDLRMVVYQDCDEHLNDFATFSAAVYDGRNEVGEGWRAETVMIELPQEPL